MAPKKETKSSSNFAPSKEAKDCVAAFAGAYFVLPYAQMRWVEKTILADVLKSTRSAPDGKSPKGNSQSGQKPVSKERLPAKEDSKTHILKECVEAKELQAVRAEKMAFLRKKGVTSTDSKVVEATWREFVDTNDEAKDIAKRLMEKTVNFREKSKSIAAKYDVPTKATSQSAPAKSAGAN